MTYTDYEKTLDIAGPLIQGITSWSHLMPMASTDPSTPMGQNGTIGLASTVEMEYHYIHLSITRAMLRPFLQSPTNETQSSAYCALREQVRSQARACISAATEFVRNLSTNDREIFWPVWSATFFSSLCFQTLLMVTSSFDKDEATYYLGYLQQLRRDMRLKADALPCLRLGLLRIDSIFWKGIDTVFCLTEHARQAYLESTKAGNFRGGDAISRCLP